MKSYIIISGGRVDLYSLQEIMDRHLESSRVIAVDKGIETCNKIGIVPDVIVGDFDSASKVTVGVYRKMAKKMHSIQFVDLDTQGLHGYSCSHHACHGGRCYGYLYIGGHRNKT